MTELTAWTSAVGRDPFLLYTLLAAALLGVVSLLGGWRRADWIPVLQPRAFLVVTLSVVAATAVLWLTQTLIPESAPSWLGARGLARFPLYVAALAYGPSAGLLAGLLFTAFAAEGTLPGPAEAVLTLELVVLGWFAIAPSPRRHRWAGPFGAASAYALAWVTGGSAMLQALTGSATSWVTQWSFHQGQALGVLMSCLLLFAVGPSSYRRLFPDSRIGGGHLESADEAERETDAGRETNADAPVRSDLRAAPETPPDALSDTLSDTAPPTAPNDATKSP